MSTFAARRVLLALLLLQCHVSFLVALFDPVAPYHHRAVSSGARCVAANLPSDDFCQSVVEYPVSSRLLHERAEDGVLSSAHHGNEAEKHAQLLHDNALHLVLSPRARAEYESLRAAHLEALTIQESLPGGVLYRAAHAASVAGDATADPSTSVPEVDVALLPASVECDRLLRQYTCMNQFPRCVEVATPTQSSSDDNADTWWAEDEQDEASRPLELHTCYSLCHAVQSTCLLHRRVDCHAHHSRLDPLHVPPSSHSVKFAKDEDPYAHFWLIDCIESPPSRAKHAWHWLRHGGPVSYVGYALGGLLVFVGANWLMGLSHNSSTQGSALALELVRAQRLKRRAQFARSQRRAQERVGKLQQMKARLVQAMEEDRATLETQPLTPDSAADTASSSSSSSSTLEALQSARAARLNQLDSLLSSVQSALSSERAQMKQSRTVEVREDVAAGRLNLATVSPRALRAYLDAGAGGPVFLGEVDGGAEGAETAALIPPSTTLTEAAWGDDASEDEEEEDALAAAQRFAPAEEEEEDEADATEDEDAQLLAGLVHEEEDVFVGEQASPSSSFAIRRRPATVATYNARGTAVWPSSSTLSDGDGDVDAADADNVDDDEYEMVDQAQARSPSSSGTDSTRQRRR